MLQQRARTSIGLTLARCPLAGRVASGHLAGVLRASALVGRLAGTMLTDRRRYLLDPPALPE